MKVLLDTNIIVNYLHDTAMNEMDMTIDSLIVRSAIFKEFDACITSTMVTDIWYMYLKELKMASEDGSGVVISDRRAKREANKMLKSLLQRIDVLPITAEDVNNALCSNCSNFEEAVQYHASLANNIDMIVTRNVKDFKNSSIKVLSPVSFRTYLRNR